MSESPTVFIVDDDHAVRKSMAWLLEASGYAVKHFATAAEFLEHYSPDMPGCLVLDVRMPGMNGLELQRELNRLRLTLPVIVLTGYADVPMAVASMKAGAVEFLEKPVPEDVLLDRVQHALDLDWQERQQQATRQEILERIRSLTPRQRQVMELVVDGWSSKEIGQKLQVSYKTVEAHRVKIMEKMQARSVPHLIRMRLSVGDIGESDVSAATTAEDDQE